MNNNIMKNAENKQPYILAIDHGTSGCKVAVISIHGEVVDSAFEPTPMYFSQGGGAEQETGDWWDGIVNATKKIMGSGKVKPQDIVSVAVSSTFSTTVAVDKQGKALMRAITWMDSRGAPYIKKAMAGMVNIQGYGLSKILPWIQKTAGGPQLSGKDDIAHVLFIQNKYPEVYEKTYKFLGSKDYLNLKLTGQFSASYDSIMLFWITDTRDINNIQYDDTLIKRLKIDKEKLPGLIKSTDIVGTLTKEAAESLGLNTGVKVASCSPDHQSALVGSGAVRDFEGHLYIGTSSWIECIVPFKKTDMFHSIASIPSALPGKYQCIDEQDIAGGSLPFLLNNILFYKNGLNQALPPDTPYQRMDKIAEQVPPGSNGVIFTPWLNGERSPVDTTTLRGGVYNISVTTNINDIIRAFFEGVAYNTRWNLRYVEKFAGRKFETINIVGGGAQSDIWCQIFADVLNRNIRQVNDPMQANARGAAFIALVSLGYISFDDIPSLIRYNQTFSPDKKNSSLYENLFHEFLNIYKKNKAMYHRLNSL
jgi:xylulokinase